MMAEGPRDNEPIRQALSEAHRSTRHRTPEFAELWSRAAAQTEARRSSRRTRLVVVAAAAAMVIAVTIGVRISQRRSQTELEEAVAMASAVSEWRAPLDFLLDTPGRDWLAKTPSWDVELTTEPPSLPTDLLQEVSQ